MFSSLFTSLERMYFITKVCNTIEKTCEMMLTTRGLILIFIISFVVVVFLYYKILKIKKGVK
jgi:hypothetical protein